MKVLRWLVFFLISISLLVGVVGCSQPEKQYPQTSPQELKELNLEKFNAVPEAVQEASRAVVIVQVSEEDVKKRVDEFMIYEELQSPERSGSGIVVTPHHILTAFHVVQSAFGMSAEKYLPVIVTIGYEDKVYRATPVAFDANFDLALLRVDEELPVYAKIAPMFLSDSPWGLSAVDTDLYLVGFPQTQKKIYRYQYTDGDENLPVFGATFWVLSIKEDFYYRGFSGGPLLNPRGEIVGIFTQGNYKGPDKGEQLFGPSAPIIQEFLKIILSQ